MSAQAAYTPQIHLREASLVPAETCLLFIDCQKYACVRSGAEYAGTADDPKNDYWWGRMKTLDTLWPELRQLCRDNKIEVMYTVMQSLTKDGRDRSLDYKISGHHIPPGSVDAEMVDCILPGDDEIVLPKTSSSVFISTNIDYLLRCLGVKQLILVGCLTDQCVESALRDACDANYLVTLVPDCCATYSQERHDNTLRAIKGYCRQRTLQQLKEELSGSKPANGHS